MKRLEKIKGESLTRESLLAKKALNKRHILATKTSKCKCQQNCLGQFSARDIFNLRERYWSKSRQAQAQFLVHSASMKVRNGRFTYIRLDTGKEVCQRAFCSLLRVNKNALTSARKQSKRDAKAGTTKSEKTISKKVIQTMNWFEDFAKVYGDRMPNTKDILLPYKTRKVCVFEKYKSDILVSDQISKTMFFTMWKERFPYLKIKEVNSFSQCVKCAGFAKKLEQTLKPSKRAKILKRRAAHHERQMLERKYYYRKREQSRADPEGYLSLIIDGMDQAKSNLPHFTGRRPKNINPFDLLKTHISGVINHGQRRFDTYIDMNQWPHDPNLTINILLLALKKAAQAANNKLPGTLFLQADNCWRENKNKYVLSFCELLIRERIFNEVHLSFLMVGHTHEDVDAGFSQISSKLKQNDVETYEELMNILPNPTDITDMFDVKAWLEKHLSAPKKHSRPLHYRFIRGPDGDIRIQYKGLHNQIWKELKKSFFKTYENKNVYLPSGNPKILKPEFDNESLDRLVKQVTAIEHLFSKEENFDWWKTFVNKLKRKRPSSHPEWILKTLPKQTDRQTPEDESDDIPPELDRLLQMEVEETEVVITKTTVPKRRVPQKRKLKSTRNPTNKNKRNGRKHRYVTVRRTILVPLDREEKKHTWYMLLCMLLSNLLLFFVMETLLLLYILLWTNTSCAFFIIMEWFKRQYISAIYAVSNIDRHMCDHYLDFMWMQYDIVSHLVNVSC